MKKFYLTTATIRHGEFEYLDAYPLPPRIGKPTFYQCIDAVFDFWFAEEDNPQPRIEALEEFHEECFAWLPCGERIVSKIGYELDHRRMVEHYLEQQATPALSEQVDCFPQDEWRFLLGLLEKLSMDIADTAGNLCGLLSNDTDDLSDLLLVSQAFTDMLENGDQRVYLLNWYKFARGRLEAVQPSIN